MSIALVRNVALAIVAALPFAPAAGAQEKSSNPPPHSKPMSLEAPAASGKEAPRKEKAGDALTEHQSVDTFCSLEDGTPGQPGEVAIQLDSGWFTRSGQRDVFTLAPELKWTPGGNAFLDNTELTFGVPLELGTGGVQGNGDIHLGWQQRWVKENGSVPTFSTLAEIRTPSGDDSSGVDARLTGILAKEMGPGTSFFNLWMESANGHNVDEPRHFQWGFRAGYKWRMSEQLAFVGDYAHETSEEQGHGDLNLLELSGEIRVSDHLTIGPGIIIGLDDNDETPNFGAGVRLEYTFE